MDGWMDMNSGYRVNKSDGRMRVVQYQYLGRGGRACVCGRLKMK